MIQFLVIAGLLTLLAVGFVAWPLLRGKDALSNQRRQSNQLIYQERLATIAADVESGRMSETQAQALRDEVGRTLLSDLDGNDESSAVKAKAAGRRWPMLLAVLLVLPAMTVGVYLQSDSWLLIDAKQDEPAWGYVLKQIEQRLAAQPDDVEALLMLARTRRATQDIAGAIEAYTRLNAASQFSNAEYLTDEAETRVMTAQGDFDAVTVKRLEQALAVAPDYGRALWYAGLAALSQDDKKAALAHWKRLEKQALPEAFHKVLVQQLVKLGVPEAELSAKGVAQQGPRIQLRIVADEKLIEGLPGNTPIFVMAKPADGSKAMLAVRKHRLDELPLDTTLADGMNMAGGPQLSSTDAWQVTVRVAVSGDALPQSDDPFTSAAINSKQLSKAILLSIDQRWP